MLCFFSFFTEKHRAFFNHLCMWLCVYEYVSVSVCLFVWGMWVFMNVIMCVCVNALWEHDCVWVWQQSPGLTCRLWGEVSLVLKLPQTQQRKCSHGTWHRMSVLVGLSDLALRAVKCTPGLHPHNMQLLWNQVGALLLPQDAGWGWAGGAGGVLGTQLRGCSWGHLRLVPPPDAGASKEFGSLHRTCSQRYLSLHGCR